jgi:hypothetical protein
VRHSLLAPNALGVAALLTFLAGCSGGSAQTPALSGSTNSLGQAFARQVTSLGPFTPNTSHGFMHAIDARTHLLYMSSWGTASVVDVLTMNGQQVGQIANGLVEPEGLFVDTKGNLWVANATNVQIYPRGSLSPSKTLTDSVGDPLDVTVCPDGTAYVADLYDNSSSNHSSIQVYAHGSTTPTGNLDYTADFRNPFLTCDTAGNVFVALLTGESVGDGAVIEFPHGKSKGAKDLPAASSRTTPATYSSPTSLLTRSPNTPKTVRRPVSQSRLAQPQKASLLPGRAGSSSVRRTPLKTGPSAFPGPGLAASNCECTAAARALARPSKTTTTSRYTPAKRVSNTRGPVTKSPRRRAYIETLADAEGGGSHLHQAQGP